MNSYIKKFPIDTSNLTATDKKVLEILIQAAEKSAVLYKRQKNPAYPGANFFPHDAKREEIEKAAKKNPAILDPYTVVKRDDKGKLIAVSYTVKFKKELDEVANLINEAAKVSKDKKFQAYLRAKAKDLLSDNYDKSNVLWLKAHDSKIGFVIGAFDRYLDTLFFQKRAYMAWVGVLDEDLTKEMNHFKKAVLASERKYLPGAKRAQVTEVKTRIEDTAMFAGLIADFIFVGNNLPSSADLYLIKKHGTLFTIFKPMLERRFSKYVYPIFQSLFTKDIQKEYSRKEIEEGLLRTTVLHEACHSLMRYDDAAPRLQEFFPYFDEIYTDILGIKGCGSLLLKGGVSNRDLEIFMLTTVCHGLYFHDSLKKRPHLDPYAVGHALLLDFLLKGGALTKEKDRFRIDFYRAFMAISQLSYIIEYYIALGNRNEAKEFLKKFSASRVFAQFDVQIERVLAKKK